MNFIYLMMMMQNLELENRDLNHQKDIRCQ